MTREALIVALKLFFKPLFFCDKNLAGFAAFKRSDYSPFFHLVDDSCGSCITKLEFSLKHGGRSHSHFNYAFDCVVKHIVAFVKTAAFGSIIVGSFFAFFLNGKFFDIVEDSFLMYRYYKLVFDDVELGLDEGEEKVEWLRLEIELLGAKEKTFFYVPIYENNKGYSDFKEYKLSKGEIPS